MAVKIVLRIWSTVFERCLIRIIIHEEKTNDNIKDLNGEIRGLKKKNWRHRRHIMFYILINKLTLRMKTLSQRF